MTSFAPIVGQLAMGAYLDFVLGPLAGQSRADVRALQREFIVVCRTHASRQAFELQTIAV